MGDQAEHARLSPSAASMWMNCPGSIAATEHLPNSTSEAAEEGTAAHMLLERCLLDLCNPDRFLGEVFNGYKMDSEFVTNIQGVRDFIMSRFQPDSTLHAERKVHPEVWLGNRTDLWGTVDVTIVNPTSIEIWDLKYGRGIMVEPEDNWQLIIYAIGALVALDPEELATIQNITVGICQPRKPHTGGTNRSVTYTMPQIAGFISTLAQAVAATDASDAPRIAGKKQCFWCRAKATCTAKSKLIVDMFALPDDLTNSVTLEQHTLQDPNALTPQQQVTIMENADLLRAWLTAVEDYVKSSLLEGTASQEISAAFKVVEKVGNRAFVETDLVALDNKLHNQGFTKEQRTNPGKLKTATQLVTLATKLKFSKRKIHNLEAMIERKKSARIVVPVSDKRKSISSDIVAKFAETTTPTS